MNHRVSIGGVLVGFIVLAGGWLAGASAVESGYIKWLDFRSNDVPMCAVHRAALSNDQLFTATERAYDRSGTTCTTLHGRPAGYVRVHLYGYLAGGAQFRHTYSDNASGSSTAYDSYQRPSPAAGSGCFSAGASGRQYDSDIGGYQNPGYTILSGELCWI